MLTNPGYNIRLGTFYFRSLLDGLGGSTEAALASYNGGKARVDDWLTWRSFS
jgi:soluble lytic murein transglycosylase